MKNSINIVEKVLVMDKMRRGLWNICCLLMFRPFVTPVFRRWRNIVLRCFGARVDSSAMIYASSRIWAPWNLEVGENSRIGPNATIYNVAKVSLGKNVIISQNAFICTASHRTDDISKPLADLITAPVMLGDYSWVALGAYVNFGCNIGEGAVVGACACVSSSVEPWNIVAGNPARYIKKRIITKDGRCESDSKQQAAGNIY